MNLKQVFLLGGLCLIGSGSWAGDEGVDGKDMKNVSGAIAEDPCGPWYFEVGGVFLNRESLAGNQSVVHFTGGTTSLLDVDAAALDNGWEGSPRLVTGYRVTDTDAVEASYYGFGLYRYKNQARVTGNNNLDVIFGLTNDFDGADIVSIEQTSDLNHNLELTYRRGLPDVCKHFTLLAGFRYMNINEGFDIRSNDAGDESVYSIETTNDLVGLQFGAECSYELNEVFSLDAVAKAGPYANIADHRTFLGDNNNTTTIRGFEADNVVPAFVGETGIFLVAHLDDCFSFKVGYQAIYVHGLALAQDQINLASQVGPIGTDTNEMATNGSVIYHGVLASFTFPWIGEWDLPQSLKD